MRFRLTHHNLLRRKILEIVRIELLKAFRRLATLIFRLRFIDRSLVEGFHTAHLVSRRLSRRFGEVSEAFLVFLHFLASLFLLRTLLLKLLCEVVDADAESNDSGCNQSPWRSLQRLIKERHRRSGSLGTVSEANDSHLAKTYHIFESSHYCFT